jgi:hypothetical protein
MELPNPSWAVLTLTSAPALQNCLKKIGKNPAITVVAKAEFAQSYSAQPQMAFLFLSKNSAPLFFRLSMPNWLYAEYRISNPANGGI